MRSNPCLFVLVAISLLLVSPFVSATAQRTFVSSTGVDNPSCSLAAPCRAFAAAITATSASGEVIVLDSAGYGPVTITKSVSIIAPAGIYAGISVFTGDGITVNAPGAIVVLRGLTINGQSASSGSGVNLQQVARLRIENCVISKMAVNGVLHSAPGAEIVVLDTIVRDNGASGIGGDANAFVVLDHVRSEHNGTNGFYMASLTSEAHATITDSIFAFNGSNGVWVASTNVGTTFAQVERSVMADNGGVGVKVSGREPTTATRATVTRNTINLNGGAAVSIIGNNAEAIVSENAILHGDSAVGISADGGNTTIAWASANTVMRLGGAADFEQKNTAIFFRYGNNVGASFFTGTLDLTSAF